MSGAIHPSSIVSDDAHIAPEVTIGPFCKIGSGVTVGTGCMLHSHIVIDGNTEIGENNEFYPFTSIGASPQVKAYDGEPTKTIIGDRNVFREMVQVHRGTPDQKGETRIGSDNYFMTCVHIAHDCVIGNHVIMSSYCGLSGHVTIQDYVSLGGNSGAVQFVTIGKSAFIGGGSVIDKDIPPYFAAYGNRIELRGINIVGLKRNGVERNTIIEAVDFISLMKTSGLSPRAFVNNLDHGAGHPENNLIRDIVKFIAESKIGIPGLIP